MELQHHLVLLMVLAMLIPLLLQDDEHAERSDVHRQKNNRQNRRRLSGFRDSDRSGDPQVWSRKFHTRNHRILRFVRRCISGRSETYFRRSRIGRDAIQHNEWRNGNEARAKQSQGSRGQGQFLVWKKPFW